MAIQRLSIVALNICALFCDKEVHSWDIVLPHAEFAYNTQSTNLTGFSPFCIRTCYEEPMAIDLAPLPPMFSVSASAIEFFQHIKEVQEEVRKLLEDTYVFVKAHVNPHRRTQKFEVGDWLLVYMR